MNLTYTQADAPGVARTLLESLVPGETATVLGLSGDLGAGKTTLTQEIARALGVQEQVVSPTFVIAKFYETTDARFTQLIHIDAYRIEEIAELQTLGFERMLALPNTLIIIEWPERVKELLPQSTAYFTISHDIDQRHIQNL